MLGLIRLAQNFIFSEKLISDLETNRFTVNVNPVTFKVISWNILFSKLIYDDPNLKITTQQMFIVFASLSSISWLKTFFFSPFQSPVIGQSVISISAFSKIKNIFRSTSSENDSKIPEVTDLTVEPIINSILSLDYLVSSL